MFTYSFMDGGGGGALSRLVFNYLESSSLVSLFYMQYVILYFLVLYLFVTLLIIVVLSNCIVVIFLYCIWNRLIKDEK